jgi:cytochrome c oxidase subunit 2
MPRLAHWHLTALGLVVVALFGAGCTQLADPNLPQTTVFPASDWGKQIQDLYVLLFWMALVVFVGVEGFLLYAVVRFRRRRDNEMPTQVHGNTRLEVTWTVLPSLVLLVIAVPSMATIFASNSPPVAANDALKVRVIGHQWWWEFQYPELGVTTANELHLPVGRTAVFDLESIDVIHSFWIPRMGGKIDAVPGHTNHMWFTPQETGEYLGQCVEFCGTQHANMRLRAIVQTQGDFDAWVQRQRAPATEPIPGLVQRGSDVFLGSACIGCHTIRGTRAQGTVGPDLTHVGSRQTIASGMIENTPQNMKQWIQHPQEVKVGSKMPNLNLTDADATAIATYLLSLK